jgi:hypothetical protein
MAASLQLRLIDRPDGPGRTTATLLASLAARLATLHFVSGADAIGSLTAGFAALGREISRTAQGARMREAIEASRAGANGELLWSSLRIAEWASAMPPSPILDQMRNDMALLLADDLAPTLQFMPIPAHQSGVGAAEPAPSNFADCVLGLWAFSRELVRMLESIAAPTMPAANLRESAPAPEPPTGPLLR